MSMAISGVTVNPKVNFQTCEPCMLVVTTAFEIAKTGTVSQRGQGQGTGRTCKGAQPLLMRRL